MFIALLVSLYRYLNFRRLFSFSTIKNIYHWYPKHLHTKKGDVQGLKDSLYLEIKNNKCRSEEMFKYATVHNLLEVVSTISVKTIIYVYKITIPFYKFTITSLQIHVIFSTSSQ